MALIRSGYNTTSGAVDWNDYQTTTVTLVGAGTTAATTLNVKPNSLVFFVRDSSAGGVTCASDDIDNVSILGNDFTSMAAAGAICFGEANKSAISVTFSATAAQPGNITIAYLPA